MGTVRRELLDHVIVINERQLQRLLLDYVAYYNEERMHTRLRDSPTGRAVQGRQARAVSLRCRESAGYITDTYGTKRGDPGPDRARTATADGF